MGRIKQNENKSQMYELLEPIYPMVTWQSFSRTYFDKSTTWLYNKINNISPFHKSELQAFRDSLLSFAADITACADAISEALNETPTNE